MTNREKFITKRNEYDLMMTINATQPFCPIEVIGVSRVKCECELPFGSCKDCIERWLNEEAK